MKFKSLLAGRLYELHKLTDISMTITDMECMQTTHINCNFGDSDIIKKYVKGSGLVGI